MDPWQQNGKGGWQQNSKGNKGGPYVRWVSDSMHRVDVADANAGAPKTIPVGLRDTQWHYDFDDPNCLFEAQIPSGSLVVMTEGQIPSTQQIRECRHPPFGIVGVIMDKPTAQRIQSSDFRFMLAPGNVANSRLHELYAVVPWSVDDNTWANWIGTVQATFH